MVRTFTRTAVTFVVAEGAPTAAEMLGGQPVPGEHGLTITLMGDEPAFINEPGTLRLDRAMVLVKSGETVIDRHPASGGYTGTAGEVIYLS